jgi:hypothetical protein
MTFQMQPLHLNSSLSAKIPLNSPRSVTEPLSSRAQSWQCIHREIQEKNTRKYHPDRINAFFEALLIFWALIDYMQTQPTLAYVFKAICAFCDKNFPKLQPKKAAIFIIHGPFSDVGNLTATNWREGF